MNKIPLDEYHRIEFAQGGEKMNNFMNPQIPYGQQVPYAQPMMNGQQMPNGQMMQPEMMGQMPQAPMGTQTDWKDFCNSYMNHFVNMQTTDGMQHEGIIEGVDQENMYMLVPDGDTREDDEEIDERFGYGYGGFWGFPGYGYPYGYPRRFRRFRRRRFPFFSIGRFYFPFFF